MSPATPPGQAHHRPASRVARAGDWAGHLDGHRGAVLFLGVSTAGSSVHQLFPRWCSSLPDQPQLLGVDLPANAPPQLYRDFVIGVRRNQRVRGVVITSHKLALYAAAAGLIDRLAPPVPDLAEVNSIRRDPDGTLTGFATDLEAAGLAMRLLLTAEPAACTVVMFGAGGAAVAISHALAALAPGATALVLDPDSDRVDHLRSVTAELPLALHARRNDDGAAARVLAETAHQRPGAPGTLLVINATGLGKDRPGSPLPDGTMFPDGAVVWDLNYRGSLEFLHQAKAQQAARHLRIEDGWNYFLHGWSTTLRRVLPHPPSTLGEHILTTPRPAPSRR